MLAQLSHAASYCKYDSCGYTQGFFDHYFIHKTPLEELTTYHFDDFRKGRTFVKDKTYDNILKELDTGPAFVSLDIFCQCTTQECYWPLPHDYSIDHSFVLLKDGEKHIICDSYLYKRDARAEYIDLNDLKDLIENPTHKKWCSLFKINQPQREIICNLLIDIGLFYFFFKKFS